MRNRLLRSVLGAAFSALISVGVLSGLAGAKSDVRAITEWPTVAVRADTTARTGG